MHRFALCLTLFCLVAFAGSAWAGNVPPFPHLAGTWSHAEINVTIAKKPHTLILDRGRIIQVSATQLKLREGAGVVVTVPLSAQTIVNVYGFQSSVEGLERRMNVLTMRIDGGTAVRVRATS
ncbi:MAG: hypothetical protein H0X39_18645 [Actinobacteria bacterium]|nr:hypothetical protein [Actinomycetota bacterium]